MIFKQKNFKRARAHLLRTCAAILLFLGIIYYSSINFYIANIFFGNVPLLYNITFANFFFWQASHPPIGKATEYAHHQLSRTYFIQGKFEQSIEEAKLELKNYPDHVATEYILGLTYGYLGEEEVAIKHFGEYIKANPKAWAPRNDKAWLEFRIGKIRDALRTIGPVASQTGNPWVQNTYGTILLNLKDYSGACLAYENALSVVATMKESSWGRAYPGNDPRVYPFGLSAMKKSIESNLKIAKNKNCISEE